MKETREKPLVVVSEKWREKHEGRMRTVGICRGEGEGKFEGEKEERKAEKEEPTPLSSLDKINSLGDGWEW